MIAKCCGCDTFFGKDDCKYVGYAESSDFYCSADCVDNSGDYFFCRFCGEIELLDITFDGDCTNLNVFGGLNCCNSCFSDIKAGEKLSPCSTGSFDCFHCFKDLPKNALEVVFLNSDKSELKFYYCDGNCFKNSNIVTKSEDKIILNVDVLEKGDPLISSFVNSYLIKPTNKKSNISYIDFLKNNDIAFINSNIDKKETIIQKFNVLKSKNIYETLGFKKYDSEDLGSFCYYIPVPNKDFIVLFNLSSVLLLNREKEYKVICNLNKGDRKELLNFIESSNLLQLDIFNVINDSRRSPYVFLNKVNMNLRLKKYNI